MLAEIGAEARKNLKLEGFDGNPWDDRGAIKTELLRYIQSLAGRDVGERLARLSEMRATGQFPPNIEGFHRLRSAVGEAVRAAKRESRINGTPMSVDEAYYFSWSRTPDWGYWTKPPLIAWAIGAVDVVCGPTSACVRSVGVLAFTVSALLVYALSRLMAMPTGLAATASLCFATLPLATFYGLAASTDSMLLLCWVAAMANLWIALNGKRRDQPARRKSLFDRRSGQRLCANGRYG